MLREMGVRPTTISFKLDDKPEQNARGVATVIANAGQIGGGFSFAPDAKMDDGVLDLCLSHRFYFRDALRMMWRSITRSLPEDRAISFFQAARLETGSDAAAGHGSTAATAARAGTGCGEKKAEEKVGLISPNI